MKTLLKIALIVAALIAAGAMVAALLTPWMDRWGTTEAELTAVFPGDELVPIPVSVVNRAVTIDAAPEEIFPWILQIGAGKGGWYSYSGIETYLLNCPITNTDRIHQEWQNLKVGDLVKMCPGEFAPPPYEVALIIPDEAMIMGHKENGQWVELWQFVLLPQPDGSTRLVTRTRTTVEGGFWTVIHPGVFVMERGMLLGIKTRAESTDLSAVTAGKGPFATPAASVPISMDPAPTPTPEVFMPLDPAPTASGSDLPLTCQVTDLNVYIDRAAGYCFAYPLNFTLGRKPSDSPSVEGPGRVSPVEPLRASLGVVMTPFDASKSLQQQADEFVKDFTVFDPANLPHAAVNVGGETGLMIDSIPVQLSWRIIFVEHNGSLYRLMYFPTDGGEVQQDFDDLYQTTVNSFSFITH